MLCISVNIPMELKLKPGVSMVLFLALFIALLSAKDMEHPEGTSRGIWRGEVRTITAGGAMLSTAYGGMWVSSEALCKHVLSGDSLLVLGSRNGGFIFPFSIRAKTSQSPVRKIRAGFRSLLERRIGNSRARGLAGGLLMGLRGMITRETSDAFRNSGTSHLLALSGLHTAAAAALMMLISGFLFGKRTISYVLAVMGIAVFVVVSGARPSTVRAGIMSICALLWMSRRGGRIHILSFWWLALILSILILPDTLTDGGAWMSYGAVLSLILLGKNFSGKAGFLLSPLMAGVTVTTALAPLITSMYGGFAWLGPAATVLSLPLMTAVMLLGVLAAVGVPAAEQLLTAVSTFWHGMLGFFYHEPVTVPHDLMWFLWVPALTALRVFSRWNGFHRRFR